MNLKHGDANTKVVEGLSGWCARHDVPYNAAVRARDRGQLAVRRHDERGRTHVQLHGVTVDQLRGQGQRRQPDAAYKPSDRPRMRDPRAGWTTAQRTSLAERARARRRAA